MSRTRGVRVSPPHTKQDSSLFSVSHSHVSNRTADIKDHNKIPSLKSEHAHRYGLFSHNQRRKASIRHINCLSPIKPDQLSEDDINFVDPGRGPATDEIKSAFRWVSNLSSLYVKPGPIETLSVRPTPTPTSRESLHQNLLSLISHSSKSPASLRSLISYHSLPHCALFQSTQSYNLLLSLAIRHASFGTAERLLAMMHIGGFKGNMTTWKLRVRLMVRSGKWDEAWRSVMDVLNSKRWRLDGQGSGMPLVIWMEFFTPMKRGAIRKLTEFGLEVVKEIDMSERRRRDKSTMSLDAQRLDLLMKHAPSLTPKEYTRIPARAVYFIIWMMLRAGHFDDAKKMTQSYLGGLPPRLDPREVRASLDIIHLHIPWGSRKQSPLDEHYDVRHIVETFLAMHKDLRPDARTLYLLLRSLRRTTYSGTIARQAANAFCHKWGFRAESQHVRRRITTFAVKENNHKLAKEELRRASLHRFQQLTYAAQSEKLGGAVRMGHNGPLTHAMKRIYQRRGVEARRWQHLERKVKRMKTAKK